MRYAKRGAIAVLVLLAACGSALSPYGGGGGGGQGGGGGGPVGAVTVGPGIQFVSAHDGSQNPAVTMIGVGQTVTWTWSGSLQHSVESTGATSFTSSSIMSRGSYAVQFNTAGTYHYICAVHGASMSGTVIVQ
jgi:plastocyanin